MQDCKQGVTACKLAMEHDPVAFLLFEKHDTFDS